MAKRSRIYKTPEHKEVRMWCQIRWNTFGVGNKFYLFIIDFYHLNPQCQTWSVLTLDCFPLLTKVWETGLENSCRLSAVPGWHWPELSYLHQHHAAAVLREWPPRLSRTSCCCSAQSPAPSAAAEFEAELRFVALAVGAHRATLA